ncbi:MAG: flagellin [Oscillospiraceae bacterium]
MVVQHNIASMNANRYYNINNSGLSKSLEKLSSGYQINRAGDNAAGLAVSEKMRSQIGGLTQGVKNAQDGISMIQTYEGALTETDAILQRMKTLADQAANGTYQDDVDRDAIQLEFNQLNDELDQIADTDFNGVVMLNGGQMADGTKAVNGKFDYANASRKAMQLSDSDIDTLNDTLFTKENADAAWAKWSTGGNTIDRSDVTKMGPDSVDITFTYDGTTKAWTATSTSDSKFDVTQINKYINNAAVGDTAAATTSTTKGNNGGFTLYTGGTAVGTAGEIAASVIVDESTLKSGDTITLTFNNPSTINYAPGNATLSVTDNGLKANTGKTNPTDAEAGKVTIAAGDYKTQNQTAADKIDLTEVGANAFNAIKDSEISATYTDGKVSELTFKLADGTTATMSTAGAKGTASIQAKDGTKLSLEAAADTGALTITDADGKKLFTITPHEGAADADGQAKSGTVSYKLGFDTVQYSEGNSPTVEVSNPDVNSVSTSNSNKAATATLTYTDNLTLQAGARTKDSVNFSFKYTSNGLGDLKANMDCSARTGGLGTKNLSLLTQADANKAIDKIDNAINKVSMVRATFGATQNRLEHKIDNMNVTKENITSAESRIRDTDVSEEMANFTKNQILSQASQSMLAQANSLPQNVLQLLG